VTQPNLDALAKLAPFHGDDIPCANCDWTMRGKAKEADIAAALNEWAELRKENAKLRYAVHMDVQGDGYTFASALADLIRDHAEAEKKAKNEAIDHQATAELLIDAQREITELRAYRKRTEAERSEMIHLLAYCKPRVQSYSECYETYCANGNDHDVRERIEELLDSAEGYPAPKEASDDQ
jgi:hypothetical protein